jgi:MOSC domain-containing protein YiiM
VEAHPVGVDERSRVLIPRGEVVAIHLTAHAGAAMRSVERAAAVVGAGLVGDRYATREGTYSQVPSPGGGREVTLFEAEVLDALKREHQIELAPAEHRRNITTRGLDLHGLIGQRFRIGDVLLEGVRECTPCAYLQQHTGKAVLQPLVGRGGLRANVLEGGMLRRGDVVAPVTQPASARR